MRGVYSKNDHVQIERCSVNNIENSNRTLYVVFKSFNKNDAVKLPVLNNYLLKKNL